MIRKMSDAQDVVISTTAQFLSSKWGVGVGVILKISVLMYTIKTFFFERRIYKKNMCRSFKFYP